MLLSLPVQNPACFCHCGIGNPHKGATWNTREMVQPSIHRRLRRPRTSPSCKGPVVVVRLVKSGPWNTWSWQSTPRDKWRLGRLTGWYIVVRFVCQAIRRWVHGFHSRFGSLPVAILFIPLARNRMIHYETISSNKPELRSWNLSVASPELRC